MPAFLARAGLIADTNARQEAVNRFVHRLSLAGQPLVLDSTVYFVYAGPASHVSVAGDLNEWRPTADTMSRLPGTNLFFLAKTFNPSARCEYKLVVDSQWILDPLNRLQAMGGFGPNSEIRMPSYRPAEMIAYRAQIPHGSVDTFTVASKTLNRSHPTYVYLPPEYASGSASYPVLYVTDGGEYLSLAAMARIIDNMIADKRILPIVAVFLDPRTDAHDPQTNRRMQDYALSDSFLTYLTGELVPQIVKSYRVLHDPQETAIMGASLGGLVATYAAFRHPDVFGLCAAQSPAYWWKENAIIRLLDNAPAKPIRFYIDTGTLHDAEVGARGMRDVLIAKGYPVTYAEYPEGHNWTNWQARIPTILTTFWGKP